MGKIWNRQDLIEYIDKNYQAKAEYLWAKYPNYIVFRNKKGKWFAVIIDINPKILGLDSSQDKIDILNVKCEPYLASAIADNKLFFKAYHMNKKHWLTINLGIADGEMIGKFVKSSHELSL